MLHALNWIDGNWVDSSIHAKSINPATYDEIGTWADASVDDAKRSIAAAKRAFRHRDALVNLLSMENGKIKPEAAFEVDMVPSKLRFYGSLARTDFGRALEPKPGSLSVVLKQPMGVAAVIAPWNSPVVLMIRSLAPALAAGCTTVIKMPGQTAQTNSLVANIMSEAADLPRGVINLFTESHYEASTVLIESADVPTISFTGSSRTGRTISKTGSDQLKRFGHELGGKNPMVVFDDADLALAVPVLQRALTVFAGQFCMTGGRILVQRGVSDAFRTQFAAKLEAIKVGPASDPASEMGPLIDKPNVERVDKVVKDAIRAGAKVVVRGGPVLDGPLAKGAFYRPTLLEVTDPSLPIVQEETFAAVATMMVFDTGAEAIDLANNTEYGLCASIWTRDVDRGWRVAREIDAGTVWINDWAVIYDECEEGGFKQSGVGRMNGIAVMEDFIEYKHITLSHG
jgi:betaine-aldehyde dehydrogenase